MTIQPETQHPRKIEGSDLYSVGVVIQDASGNIGIAYYDFDNEEWITPQGECVNSIVKSWHYSMFV